MFINKYLSMPHDHWVISPDPREKWPHDLWVISPEPREKWPHDHWLISPDPRERRLLDSYTNDLPVIQVK